MSDKMSLPNDDMLDFAKEIEKAKKKHNVESKEELKEKLPAQNYQKHGLIKYVGIDDIALTESGAITKTQFFDKLNLRKEKYKDITLTEEEARSLSMTMMSLSTGVNASLPLQCTGEKCPFRNDCWYYLNDKAPIGRPCPIEADLLQYHTIKFIEEFDVDPQDHSELMLIQELSELIVYEMRATRKLAEADSAELYGLKTKFSPDGEPIMEETIHWAVTLKETYKNRRMKILDSLNATRKNKIKARDAKDGEDESVAQIMKDLKDVIIKNQKDTPYKEV